MTLAALVCLALMGSSSPGTAAHLAPNEPTVVVVPGPTLQDSVDLGRASQDPPADFDWKLRPLRGPETTLDAFRGKLLFINMWATWCGPCVRELGSIQRLVREFADTEVAFLLVSPEEPRTVEAFLRRYSYGDLPVFLEIQEMPSAFGLEALPTTYVVDREGRIALKHRGALEWDDPTVGEFLRALLLD